MSWWVQAEALVGFLNAWQLTGKREFLEAFEKQARYTLENFVDRKYGEWHQTIQPDGTITGPKASDWKAPYHAGRACLEIIRRLRESKAARTRQSSESVSASHGIAPRRFGRLPSARRSPAGDD
jgi:mannose/cellobiose epimerase-like protein (N-acyl-D-glucosamine 2-epimerase family)